METIKDITCEMRIEFDQSWWDVDREENARLKARKVYSLMFKRQQRVKWELDHFFGETTSLDAAKAMKAVYESYAKLDPCYPNRWKIVSRHVTDWADVETKGDE